MPELFECECGFRNFLLHKNGLYIYCDSCQKMYDIQLIQEEYEKQRIKVIRTENRV